MVTMPMPRAQVRQHRAQEFRLDLKVMFGVKRGLVAAGRDAA